VHVSQTRRFPLGEYRGLRFGITMHSIGGAEVYLEGAATRDTLLSREHHGPRAVLNAFQKLANGYESECERVGKDLELAESQLRDYQARLGAPFAHKDYLDRLTTLRDRLKAGLSGMGGEDDGTPVLELAERIKELRVAHTAATSAAQTTAERPPQRRDAGEEPVTARIRRRAEERTGVNGEGHQKTEVQGKWQRSLAEEAKSNAERGLEPG
jgi:hypothetical protein